MKQEDIAWWVGRVLISPVVWFLVLLILALGWVGSMDLEDAIRADQTYCNMVRDYKRTDGAIGWPDYEERYDRDCLDNLDR